jgi:hypothetical protein
MVAAKIATLPKGRPEKIRQLADLPTQEQAGEMLNVGERTIRRAREVIDEGVPELAEKVDRGDVSVSAASEVATLPKEQPREIVARGERKSPAGQTSGAASQCN